MGIDIFLFVGSIKHFSSFVWNHREFLPRLPFILDGLSNRSQLPLWRSVGDGFYSLILLQSISFDSLVIVVATADSKQILQAVLARLEKEGDDTESSRPNSWRSPHYILPPHSVYLEIERAGHGGNFGRCRLLCERTMLHPETHSDI